MIKKFILFILIFTICACISFGAETKQIKKTVSQSTSKENKTRKQNFDLCLQSGKNRSYCYYLFY